MSERYKREIEEILQQAGELGSLRRTDGPRRSFLRLVWLSVIQAMSGGPWSIAPGRVMLAAIVLVLLALIVGATGLGFTGLLGWTGLILFIIGYAMFFIRPTPVEKRWRGRSIDDKEVSWWDRLRGKTR